MKKYTIVNDDQLDADLTTVANAIRERAFTTEDLDFPSEFESTVKGIPDYLALYLRTMLTEYSSNELGASLPTSVFSGRTDIVSVNLPNWTGGAAYGFNGCTNLANVRCDGLKAIGNYCFLNCKSLTRMELPSLTYISEGSFKGCEKLETVIIGTESSTNVATLQNVNAFEGTPIASGKGFVYVPNSKEIAYKEKWRAVSDTAENWIKPYSALSSN